MTNQQLALFCCPIFVSSPIILNIIISPVIKSSCSLCYKPYHVGLVEVNLHFSMQWQGLSIYQHYYFLVRHLHPLLPPKYMFKVARIIFCLDVITRIITQVQKLACPPQTSPWFLVMWNSFRAFDVYTTRHKSIGTTLLGLWPMPPSSASPSYLSLKTYSSL